MTQIWKQCLKCGTPAKVKPRERRCKRQPFGQGSYACWGQLIRMEQKKEQKPKLSTAEHDRTSPHAWRTRAAAKLAKAQLRQEKARARMKEHLAAAARAMQQEDQWRRRETFYFRMTQMTDEQIAEDRARRKNRPRKVRRGMDL
jgi:hypothetical protein